jgi:hypothetical protein
MKVWKIHERACYQVEKKGERAGNCTSRLMAFSRVSDPTATLSFHCQIMHGRQIAVCAARVFL